MVRGGMGPAGRGGFRARDDAMVSVGGGGERVVRIVVEWLRCVVVEEGR